MSPPPLSCTVRDCGAPLFRRDRVWSCLNGHTYDIARRGYVNLLQPQDRRSLDAGDSRESVEARAALLARGIGRGAIDAVVERAVALTASGHSPVVAELGSGSGEALGLLTSRLPSTAVGIDLSTAAATLAARRFPDVTWLVANADRRLPLLDARVDLVLSVHARRNPVECRRVLRADGRLLVAIPGADDLIELREAVQGAAVEKDRVAALVEEHAEQFEPREHTTVRQQFELDRESLLQLLRGTYRGERLSASSRVHALERLTVTLASDVLLFAPR